jgi:hypothetical protein
VEPVRVHARWSSWSSPWMKAVLSHCK